jgi:hypothetical protein
MYSLFERNKKTSPVPNMGTGEVSFFSSGNTGGQATSGTPIFSMLIRLRRESMAPNV